MERKLQIGVIGSAADLKVTGPEVARLASEAGTEIANRRLHSYLWRAEQRLRFATNCRCQGCTSCWRVSGGHNL